MSHSANQSEPPLLPTRVPAWVPDDRLALIEDWVGPVEMDWTACTFTSEETWRARGVIRSTYREEDGDLRVRWYCDDPRIGCDDRSAMFLELDLTRAEVRDRVVRAFAAERWDLRWAVEDLTTPSCQMCGLERGPAARVLSGTRQRFIIAGGSWISAESRGPDVCPGCRDLFAWGGPNAEISAILLACCVNRFRAGLQPLRGLVVRGGVRDRDHGLVVAGEGPHGEPRLSPVAFARPQTRPEHRLSVAVLNADDGRLILPVDAPVARSKNGS